MMEEAITAFLLGNSALVQLVGDRITWDTLPQGQLLPAIVLTKISSQPEYSVDLFENKLTFSRLQIDAWGLIKSDVVFVGRAVFALLSAANTTILGIEFQAIFEENELSHFEQGTGNRDLWRNTQDFTLWHAAT